MPPDSCWEQEWQQLTPVPAPASAFYMYLKLRYLLKYNIYGWPQAGAEGDAVGVVQHLSAGGAVSPWCLAHVGELLGGAGGPRRSAPLTHTLPVSGGDQVGHHTRVTHSFKSFIKVCR